MSKKNMHKCYNKLLLAMGRFKKTVPNTVLFVSYNGQYSDNPRYISEALHTLDKDVQIIWAISETSNSTCPEYVKTVSYLSREYFHWLGKAAVVVDNYTGLRNFGFGGTAYRILLRLAQKKTQYCVSTWHGTPLKKIGNDTIKNRNTSVHASCTDSIVAGSEYVGKIFESAYCFEGKVRYHGTPRNDVLQRPVDVAALKEQLGLPCDKKIVIFAPTFRDSVEWSGKNQMETLDFERLINALNNRFGGEFAFVFRVHHSVLSKIDVEKITQKYNVPIVNGNAHNEMADYLCCTDVLITDYSGSLFDFVLTKRPCFLYAPDRENYEFSERGFYLDYGSLPFPAAEDTDTLIKNIEQFNDEEYQQATARFMTDLGYCEDGTASTKTAEDIIRFIKTGKKRF